MNFEENKNKTSSQLRTIYGLTMGVLWSAIGIFFLIHKKIGYDLQLDQTLTTIFGVSCVLYGGFRIYRGVKKN